MKSQFSEFKQYYAAKRGFSAFSALPAEVKVAAPQQINALYEQIWYAKQWGFSGKTEQLSFVPSQSVMVSGTAGERVVTFGASVAATIGGLQVEGQYLSVGTRLYRLQYRRSATVWAIEAPLASTLSSASGTILFAFYPMPYDFGAVRFIKSNGEDIRFLPEVLTEIDHSEGTPDFAHLAEATTVDLKNNGTVTVADNSRNATLSEAGEVTIDHIGKSFLLKEANNMQYFKVVDVVTASDIWVLDRPYRGDATSGVSYALEPRGTQRIGFKPVPTARKLVELKYTLAPNKLVGDEDMTLLPTDSPMYAGIDVIATQWEAVGEGNINEVLFNDKKFVKSLKVLNFRGTPLQNRLYDLGSVSKLRRQARDTNPWNRFV